jgi:predicted phosphodiesterase
VRYAILSDIHANLPALEAVLTRLETAGVDRILCLGDIVGYGASPNECCALLRQADVIAVQGNHDRAAVQPGEERWFTPHAKICILWTREQLTDENRNFLAQLQPKLDILGTELCHGSLFDPDFYTTTPEDAYFSFRKMAHNIAWIGHTHVAEWYEEQAPGSVPIQTRAPYGATLNLADGSRYLINPGAVGQPRDGNSMAAYAIWDPDAQQVQLLRVPYNIRAAQEKMQAAELPSNMSARLLLGL